MLFTLERTIITPYVLDIYPETDAVLRILKEHSDKSPFEDGPLDPKSPEYHPELQAADDWFAAQVATLGLKVYRHSIESTTPGKNATDLHRDGFFQDMRASIAYAPTRRPCGTLVFPSWPFHTYDPDQYAHDVVRYNLFLNRFHGPYKIIQPKSGEIIVFSENTVHATPRIDNNNLPRKFSLAAKQYL